MAKGMGTALSIVKYVLNRGKKENNTATMMGSKAKMAPLKKLRLFMLLSLTMTLIALLLQFLMVFAGSKPGMMEDYAVFTLNSSRIGEGIHKRVDGAIEGFNVGDLHVDLKRSIPVVSTATITAPPTTLATMAPRNVGSMFKSLTEDAGDNLESANSAAHSKVSQVKSKASSAANSAVSSINNGLDSAAGKIKSKLTELVDDTFEKIRAELDIQDFYSVHMTTTCKGDYAKGEGKDAKLHKKIESCEGNSLVNPMKWVSIFYWASIICTAVAIGFELKAIHKPEGKGMKWAMFFLFGACFLLGVGSALAHGIADSARRLARFLGSSLTIDVVPGQTFISTTWATTILLIVNIGVLYFFKWYIKRHPERASEGGSDGFADSSFGGGGGIGMSDLKDKISAPYQRPTSTPPQDPHRDRRDSVNAASSGYPSQHAPSDYPAQQSYGLPPTATPGPPPPPGASQSYVPPAGKYHQQMDPQPPASTYQAGARPAMYGKHF